MQFTLVLLIDSVMVPADVFLRFIVADQFNDSFESGIKRGYFISHVDENIMKSAWFSVKADLYRGWRFRAFALKVMRNEAVFFEDPEEFIECFGIRLTGAMNLNPVAFQPGFFNQAHSFK